MTSRSRYEGAVARIERDGEVLGAGFLVSDRHLLTCAHVVGSEEAMVDLVFLANPDAGSVTARVEVRTDPEDPDIAVLVCDAPVARTRPARLADASLGEGFIATGFPEDLPAGDTVEGKLMGPTLARLIQLESTGARQITRRFSGTAVWNVRREAVGMIVAYAEEDPTACMIPASRIAEVLRERSPRLFQALFRVFPKSSAARRRKIPALLPYLSDRSVQQDELDSALRDHRRTRPHRPFVALIHGDEAEAHDRFIDQLQVHTLPLLLGLDPVHLKKLTWSGPSGPLAERRARLGHNLAEIVVGRRDADARQLVREVANHRTPVMISTFISSQDWQPQEPDLIHDWLASLNNLPDLPHGQLLMVFLSLRYRSGTAADDGGEGFLTGLWRQRCAPWSSRRRTVSGQRRFWKSGSRPRRGSRSRPRGARSIHAARRSARRRIHRRH